MSPDQLFVDEMRARLDSYFRVVVRNVRDTVPKTIGHFLVRAAQEKMQFEFHNAISQDDRLVELLKEPQHIAEERASLAKQLEVLNKAQKVLRRDPQLARLQAELRDEQLLEKQSRAEAQTPAAGKSSKRTPPPQPAPPQSQPVERQRQPYSNAAVLDPTAPSMPQQQARGEPPASSRACAPKQPSVQSRAPAPSMAQPQREAQPPRPVQPLPKKPPAPKTAAGLFDDDDPLA